MGIGNIKSMPRMCVVSVPVMCVWCGYAGECAIMSVCVSVRVCECACFVCRSVYTSFSLQLSFQTNHEEDVAFRVAAAAACSDVDARQRSRR